MGKGHGQGLQVVGLTGGIAAGKSTVAAMFRALGASVVDADALSREIAAPGSDVVRRIAAELGPAVVSGDGGLDRQAVGRIVFHDAAARRRLEAITHPAIAEAARERFAELRRRGCGLVLYEAALLVETGRHREMDLLVVVTADDALRVARLMERGGLERQQAEARIAAQLPQRDKAALADYVIDNSGGLKQTSARVREVWRDLRSRVAEEKG